MQTFGRPDRLITCDCERSDEPSMTQVLHLYNGDTLNQKLAAIAQLTLGVEQRRLPRFTVIGATMVHHLQPPVRRDHVDMVGLELHPAVDLHRYLLRNKGYTLINTLGLAIGITSPPASPT